MPTCPNCQELAQEITRLKHELQHQIDRNHTEFSRLVDATIEARRAATEILTQLYHTPQLVELFQSKYPWIHHQ